MNTTRNACLFAISLGLGLSFSDHALATPLSGSASTGSAVTAAGTASANGVSASAVDGTGVVSTSSTGYGIRSSSTSAVGVLGTSASTDTSGNAAGVAATCPGCPAVIAISNGSDGLRAFGATTGVLGVASNGDGVDGRSDQANGVHGSTAGGGSGVFAENTGSGTGLSANATQGYAIYATSTSIDAIVGISGTTTGAAGIWGKAHGAGTFGVFSSGDLYVRGWSGTPGDAYKPGGGSWKATSDARVKKDVVPFTPALTELEQVHPVRYEYNGLGGTVDTGKQYVGVIAQDLEKVLPSMVSSHKRKLHENDAQPTDIKEVDPSAFTYVLINAVKELSAQNKQLAHEISVLSEQSKQMAEIAKLMCTDHPESKACSQALELASLPRAQAGESDPPARVAQRSAK